MPYAIQTQGLTKRYKIFASPRERVKELLGLPARHREFTALEAIDLDVARGSTVGIVGDNGAGKSTLLQIVSGAVQPTAGRVSTEGVVLALLELGLGFHPDFTGRDNIFFYSDILGLARPFVQARLERIIAFSELGEFIDQPLKTYSTGMRARLAFSLVSNLDPDILIVDEALSVGDLHFQQKCIQRMTALKKQGATILFCSHSTYQISMFCTRVVWLKQGRIAMDGPPEEVLPAYEAYQLRKRIDPGPDVTAVIKETPVRITRFEMLSPAPVTFGDDLTFVADFECRTASRFHVGFTLKMEDGRGIYTSATHLQNRPPLDRSTRSLRITLPKAPLLGGFFQAHLRTLDEQGLLIFDDAVIDNIEVRKTRSDFGLVHLENEWSFFGPPS